MSTEGIAELVAAYAREEHGLEFVTAGVLNSVLGKNFVGDEGYRARMMIACVDAWARLRVADALTIAMASGGGAISLNDLSGTPADHRDEIKQRIAALEQAITALGADKSKDWWDGKSSLDEGVYGVYTQCSVLQCLPTLYKDLRELRAIKATFEGKGREPKPHLTRTLRMLAVDFSTLDRGEKKGKLRTSLQSRAVDRNELLSRWAKHAGHKISAESVRRHHLSGAPPLWPGDKEPRQGEPHGFFPLNNWRGWRERAAWHATLTTKGQQKP